ncbi:MAG TPA: hypothetical protein PKW71_06435, partial [Anaerohalosphaeraceae bacterium]|nr:hypothetical protein [Anaerohalosphaeraceae bacterium]
GTGDEGTLKWYVDWAAVRDYVCVIDDAAVVDSVTAQQKQLLAQTEEVRKELDQRIAAWRRARRGDASARTAARTEYEAALDRLHRIQQAASIPLLVQAAADESLQPKLQQFYHQQKLWELQREKKRLSRTGDGAPRSIEDITISFGGVVKNGKIYLFHPLLNNLKFSVQLLVCVGLVTIVWLITTCITKPADPHTLRRFYKLCHPGGPGWRKVVQDAKADGEEIDSKNAVGDWKLPMQLVCVFLGCVAIYASLFAVGSFIYGHRIWGFALSAAALAAVVLLFKSFSKIGVESES